MAMTKDEAEWALLRSGKLDEELTAVKEEGQRVAVYAGLRYHAAYMGRKPGWAAHFYKDLYGEWPERGWEKVPPMRPSDDLMAIIKKRDSRFIFEEKMKRRRQEVMAQ
jgi:hypothetical protein